MNALDDAELRALNMARSGNGLSCRYAGIGGCEATCDVVIVPAPRGAVVIFSERVDNRGTSITNWFENLATQTYREHLRHLAPGSIRWFERYPSRGDVAETLDRVLLTWDGAVFKAPHWQCIAAGGVAAQAAG